MNPIYLLMGLLVFGINTVPFLMPPTWLILSFFYVTYDLHIIPTVIIGALAAVCGRVVLATLSRTYLYRFLPKKTKDNFHALGSYLNTHQNVTIPAVIGYAFLPIPSNDIFIAAGLSGLDLRLIAGSFFVGRLISYSFWVHIANKAYDHFELIFVRHFSRTNALITELIGVAILIVISQIPWKKLLKQ